MNIQFPIPPAGQTENKLLKRCFDLINAAIFGQGAVTGTTTITQPTTLVNSSSASTQNLPPAAGFAGSITIKNVGAGVVTVDPSGSETIDGRTTFELSKYHSITVVSDGSNWGIISWVKYYAV